MPLNTIYSLNAIGKNNNCRGVVFGLLIEVYSRINELLFDIESSPDLSVMSDDNLFNKFVCAKLLQRKIERCSLENLGTSLNERFLCNFITNVCSDIDREVSGLNGFISRIVLTGFGIFLTLKSSNGNGRIRNVLVYIPKGLKHNMINYTWFYKTLLRPSFFNDRDLNNDANKGAITTIIEKNKQIMLQNISSAEGNVKKWFDDIVTDIREKSIA